VTKPAREVTRRRRWPLLVAVVAIAAMVGGAWLLQSMVSNGSGAAGGGAAPYSIKVTKGGEVLKVYDLAALHALPQSTVVIDGKEQDGPSLPVLLKDAGAGRYDSVVIRGAGLRDQGKLTLTAARARKRVQLDFSDRGTAKVCGPDLYHAEWVRDVVSIDAR
jgi:hypothetical protein